MLSDQDSLFNDGGCSTSPGDLAEVTSQLFCFLASQGKDRKKKGEDLGIVIQKGNSKFPQLSICLMMEAVNSRSVLLLDTMYLEHMRSAFTPDRNTMAGEVPRDAAPSCSRSLPDKNRDCPSPVAPGLLVRAYVSLHTQEWV